MYRIVVIGFIAFVTMVSNNALARTETFAGLLVARLGGMQRIAFARETFSVVYRISIVAVREMERIG